jgi:hypothetical protein
MNSVKIASLRKQVDQLFRNNPDGTVIEFVVNDEVKGSYDIPVNHFVTLDSKTPLHWLYELLCFEVDLKGLKKPKVNLRIRR